MSCRPLLLIIACAWGLLFAHAAQAVIMVNIPLTKIIEDEQHIFVAKVSEILPDKPAMILSFSEDLKAKFPIERLPVALAGDADAKKGKHTDVLLDRIDKDTPLIIFTTKRGGKYIAFCFTEGTWFQMHGRVEKQDDKEVVRWTFLHCEPYLRRTFKGTTEELKQIVTDAIAKKKAPPALDENEPPGFGPPIKKKCALDSAPRTLAYGGKTQAKRTQAVQFPLAVIQLPMLGLIAALAALFPTVFGGLALFMKRWVAVLSTSGMVSLFVALPEFFKGWTARQWVYSPVGFWLTCAGMFTVGTFWSLRRYRRSIDNGTSEAMQPLKFDRLFVTLFFVAGLVSLTIAFAYHFPVWTNEYWRWDLAATVALGAAAWALISAYLRRGTPPATTILRIAPETVMLWVMVASCIVFGSWEAGRVFAQP